MKLSSMPLIPCRRDADREDSRQHAGQRPPKRTDGGVGLLGRISIAKSRLVPSYLPNAHFGAF
jgi:hypothetical protein